MSMAKEDYVRCGLLCKLFESCGSVFSSVEIAVSKYYTLSLNLDIICLFYFGTELSN